MPQTQMHQILFRFGITSLRKQVGTCTLGQSSIKNCPTAGEDDALSSVLIVSPSLNASLIGAGPTGAPLQPLFGNVDFKAYDIDFQNRAVSRQRRVLEVASAHTYTRPISPSVKH